MHEFHCGQIQQGLHACLCGIPLFPLSRPLSLALKVSCPATFRAAGQGPPCQESAGPGVELGTKKKPETAKKIADVHRILERRFSTAHAHICHLSCPRLPRHPPDPPGAGPRFPGWWPKGPVVFFFLTLRALARQQPIPAACNCDRTVGYMVSDQFYLKTTPMGVLCLCLGLHVW